MGESPENTANPAKRHTVAETVPVPRKALVHGLCSSQILLPWEKPGEFEVFLHRMFEELEPESPMALLFSARAVLDAWRLRRVVLYQARLMRETRNIHTLLEKLKTVSAYENRFQRSMGRALAALRYQQHAHQRGPLPPLGGKAHWFFSPQEIHGALREANRRGFWQRLSHLVPPHSLATPLTIAREGWMASDVSPSMLDNE